MSSEPPTKDSDERRFSPRALFAIFVVLAVFAASAAAYYSLGPEDSRQNAADDAAGRGPLGKRR